LPHGAFAKLVFSIFQVIVCNRNEYKYCKSATAPGCGILYFVFVL